MMVCESSQNIQQVPLFQHLLLPGGEVCFCMEFCEREELYCRNSPGVFFFADNSEFKTQSVVQLQLPPCEHAVSQVFKSQVPQSCLRRH